MHNITCFFFVLAHKQLYKKSYKTVRYFLLSIWNSLPNTADFHHVASSNQLE